MTAPQSLVFEALGGEVELFAIDPAEPLEATGDWIRRLHRQLTRFEPDSELSRFNARAGEWVEVSSELETLLGAALYSFEESEGMVNVAVLPALIAAGYDRTFQELESESRVSVSGSLELRHRNGSVWDRNGAHRNRNGALSDRNGAKAREGVEDRGTVRAPAAVSDPLKVRPLTEVLELRPRAARIALNTAVDLGGIAKGWIADRAVERLGPNSLVSCGGDLYARGGGETGEGWPVGFGDRTLLLKDIGAATSGTAKRRWGDGQHHLIDPRTGRPSMSDLTEVSVLADTALDAEIYAKTAFLLGSERAEDYLRPRSKGWALS